MQTTQCCNWPSPNMLFWIITVITLVLVYRWLNSKPKNFPPGPPTVPLLGSIPFLKRENFHYEVEGLRETYGPIVGFKIGPVLSAVICGPKEIFDVLRRDDFGSRPSVIAKFRKAHGVMFANGEAWKMQRRFLLRHLRDFGFGKATVNEMVQNEFEDFCRYKLKDSKEIEIEATGLFNTSAINLLWAIVGGARFSYEDEKFADFLNAIQRLFRAGAPTGNLLVVIPGLKDLVNLFYETDTMKTDRLIREFLRASIAEHKATRSNVPRDFLDVYNDELEKPEKHSSFSEATFVELCRDLFTAGVESSGNTLSFCLLYLVLHPEWQPKLFKEVDEVLGGRAPTLNDRLSLPLVEAFYTEVMRCNPIAPLTVPHATSKDTTIDGYYLPKDTFVHVSLWALFQDKEHFGDPENFRPERFINDGAFVRDPYMIPFGIGSRVCLGETLARNVIFLFFTSLLQKYSFSLPNGAKKPSTVCLSGFTTAPRPFKVTLKQRD